MNFFMEQARRGGDIISLRAAGQRIIQVNHPDIVSYILKENYKNYKKSNLYIRFQTVGGLGLLTSHGEKWKRDRKKIQPMFTREWIERYYFSVANDVTEKFKHKWLDSTRSGSFEVNITNEMARITTEISLKAVFGNNIDDQTIRSLHQAYDDIIHYHQSIRLIPTVDLRKTFCFPSYFKFKRALNHIHAVVHKLSQQYHSGDMKERNNMFALLLDAQKEDPDHFTDIEVRDHCVTMIFAGFETTSIALQWMWYELCDRADIREKLREDIIQQAPCTNTHDSTQLAFAAVMDAPYHDAFFKESVRLYPSFWVIGREPLEDDRWGDFVVKKGTAIALPQFVLHRDPRWWNEPEQFCPERFLNSEADNVPDGAYFPFSHGPRKCSGFLFAEMEAKTIIAKLLPLFEAQALNKVGNKMVPGISLKLERPLYAKIRRK
ncbi:MAG: cytochrome P450 [Alphaproteobacteria bacterium]